MVCVDVRSCKLYGTSRPLCWFCEWFFWVEFIPRRCCFPFGVLWFSNGFRCGFSVPCFTWCFVMLLKYFSKGFSNEFWKKEMHQFAKDFEKCFPMFSVYGDQVAIGLY